MRLAPRVRPVIFGSTIFVCQLAITAPASAWGLSWFPSADAAADAAPVQGPPSTMHRNMGATPPRWTDGAQRAATNQRIVDHAVQQAGWNDEARTAPPRVAANGPTGYSQRSPANASSGRAPLFRGYEVRMPTKLFSRNPEKTTVPPAADRMAATRRMPANRPMPAAQPFAARHGNQASGQGGFARASAGQVPRGNTAPRTAPHHGPSDLPPGTQQIGRNIPSAAAVESRTLPTATRRIPSKATDTRSADQSSSASAEPIENPQRGQAPSPNSPAEQLVAQAHQWSNSAQSEQDYSRIIETCRRARASNPTDSIATYANGLAAWALNRRGQLKAEAGRSGEAILDFDDAIRADGELWRAIHNRGVLLAQEGQFEKAFDDFNRTIDINPQFAKAFSNRAALFVVANDLESALSDYQRAIELDPNLAVAHRGQGRVCHLLGRLEDARGHYDAAVQLAPEDAYAIASRADLLTDLGRYVDAAADYDRAMEIDPSSVQAYSGSAWLLSTCPDNAVRDPELALERARIAIELGGMEDATSFDTLAAAQASTGDFAAAAKSVRQAIDLAQANERDVYHDRLRMYQRSMPYRIAPVRTVTQASYEQSR